MKRLLILGGTGDAANLATTTNTGAECEGCDFSVAVTTTHLPAHNVLHHRHPAWHQ